MLLLLCLSLFLAGCQASTSANQYMDTVIFTSYQNVLKQEKLDPTHLTDFTFDYSDKTFFGKVHGKAEYSHGELSGLSQAFRYSECGGPKNISGSTVINCTLSFKFLKTAFKGKVKYGVLPKVSIDAKGDVQHVLVDVGVAKSPSDRNPQVKSLSLRSTGTVNTTFTGLGPLNKQMGVLEDNYKVQIRDQVTNVLNNRFRYALNLAVISVPMPQ